MLSGPAHRPPQELDEVHYVPPTRGDCMRAIIVEAGSLRFTEILHPGDPVPQAHLVEDTHYSHLTGVTGDLDWVPYDPECTSGTWHYREGCASRSDPDTS